MLVRYWNSILRKGRSTEGLSGRAAGETVLLGTCREQKDKSLEKPFLLFTVWSELGCSGKTISYVYFFF